jgi:hypothetical protein
MKTALIMPLLFVSLGFAQDRPRVYVTDKQMDQASLLATRNAAVASIQRGDDPRTTEIQADIVKVCPQVTVTSRIERADFVLVFRRENGKRSAMFAFGGLAGLALSAHAKVDGASLFDVNGDMVTATKQRTVEKSVREICGSIPMTVTHQAQTQAAPAPVQLVVQPAAAPIQPGAVVTLAAYPAEAVVMTPAPAVPVAYQQQGGVLVEPATQPPVQPVSEEESLGDTARRAKQRKACLALAKDNPSIKCQ